MTQPPDHDGSDRPGWAQASPGNNVPGRPPPDAGPPYGPPAALPPGLRPPRFSGGYVAVGIFASWGVAVLALVGFTVLAGIIGGSTGASVALSVVALLVPLVAGAVLVGRGSPERRGFGLGLLIGWGIAVVVGGGACVALIAALRSGG